MEQSILAHREARFVQPVDSRGWGTARIVVRAALLMALIAAALTACGDDTQFGTSALSTQTHQPVSAAVPTPDSQPSATPPPATPSVAPTDTLEPTATPKPSPTPEPTSPPAPTPSPTPAPTMTPTATPIPAPARPQIVDDYVAWKIGGDVSVTVEAEVRDAVVAAHNSLMKLGIPSINKTVTIFVYQDAGTLEAAFKEVTGRTVDIGKNTSSNGETTFYINTSSERYQNWSAESRRRSIVGHMSDVYIRLMSDVPLHGSAQNQVAPAGPAWLFNGTRNFLSWQTLNPAPPGPCDRNRPSFSGIPASERTLLSEVETSEDFRGLNEASLYGFLAVELLSDQAGPEAIVAYYTSLQTGGAWQDAFQSAFGMTVDQFYELFEERRATGFPSPRCPALPPLVTLPGSPEYVKWEIGANVRREYIEDSVEGVRLMHEYAQSLGAPEVKAEFTAHLYYDQEELIAAYEIALGREAEWVPRGSNSVAGGASFFTNTLRWEERETPSHRRKKISAHELFHLFQQAWSYPGWEPTWIREGTAEFFAFRALDAGGALSYAEERRHRLVPGGKRVVKTLREMESGQTFHNATDPYPFALLAAELLASYAGEDAVLRFYMLEQPGITWQEAFQVAFGMTLDGFYELFEAHRAAGFPDPNGPTDELVKDAALPSYIKWVIADEVDQPEAASAIQGVKLAYEFGKSLDMPDPQGQIIIYVDNDAERLAAYYADLVHWDIETSRKVWLNKKRGAISGRGNITALAAPPGEPQGEGLRGPLRTMAHEYVHTGFQHNLAGLSAGSPGIEQYNVVVPRWLVEGMANVWTNLAISEHRGLTYAEAREHWISRARAIDLPLQDAETWPEGFTGSVGPADQQARFRAIRDCIYQCGYAAAELLASHAGVRKLADYYMLLEPWMTPSGVSESRLPVPGWHLAFEAAFGMTVDEFYELFEDHRAAGIPEVALPLTRE